MVQLLRFSVQHPRPILGIVAATTFWACFFMPRVQLRLDGRSLLPLGHPSLRAHDRATALFGLHDVVVIGVTNKEEGIYTPAGLACITRLSDRLSRVDGIVAESVTSLATVPRLFVEENTIDLRPRLARHIDLDALTRERIRLETETLGLNDGVLVASDGRAAAIYGEVRPDANRYLVLQQVREIANTEGHDGYTIYLSGTALAQAILGQAVARDLVLLIPAVIIVLGALLVIAYQHPVAALVSLAEIGVSLIWTAGLMGFSGQSVFVTTLVLPVILIAIGVSDDVYALNCYFGFARRAKDRSNPDNVVSAFSEVARPIELTAATTIAGLLSLAATSLEPQRVFGVFGAISIAFSTVLTFTLVPALLVLWNPRGHKRRARNHRRLTLGLVKMLSALNVAGPRRVLVATVLAALGAAILTTNLRIDDSWIGSLPQTSDIVKGDKALNDLLAGTTTLEFMVDSNRHDGFLSPSLLAAVGEIEEAISALPAVGAAHSVYSDVVRVNASLRGLSYSAYRDALRRGKIQLTEAEIEQALMLLQSLRRSPPSFRLDSGYQRARMTVFIRSANYKRIDSVLRTAEKKGQFASSFGAGDRARPKNFPDISITPLGEGWISYLTVRLLVVGQVRSLVLAIIADLILISLLLHSVRTALIAILPVAISVLVVFATLAVTGTPLGIANSMFAAIALGIGVDFSIHLTADYREGLKRAKKPRDAMRRAFAKTGPAILTSTVAIASGFAVLALSEVAPNMMLGMLVCLSLTVCAVMTLILVPSLAVMLSLR